MFIKKHPILRAEMPESGSDAGSGPGTAPEAALTPEMQAMIDAAVNTTVAGLKAKNAELIGANKDLRTRYDGVAKQMEGLDIDAVRSLLNKASSDEETRLMAEGKVDEVFSRRTERLRADYEKKLQAADERAAAAESGSSKLRERALDGAIRAAAMATGARPDAGDVFSALSRGRFKFDEAGNPVAVDDDGAVLRGKDGVAPLSPAEWAESLRETAPYLWPQATGAGVHGNNGGKAAKPFSDMTESERVALYRTNPQKFTQLVSESKSASPKG